MLTLTEVNRDEDEEEDGEELNDRELEAVRKEIEEREAQRSKSKKLLRACCVADVLGSPYDGHAWPMFSVLLTMAILHTLPILYRFYASMNPFVLKGAIRSC